MEENQDFISLIQHVFLPPELPQEAPDQDAECRVNILLSRTVLESAESYMTELSEEEKEQWFPVISMLKQILLTSETPLTKSTLFNDFSRMEVNDILALHIRAQNACVIVRKFLEETRFEVFEVSAKNEQVMSTSGKLICSYPGPTVAVPASVFSDRSFMIELASFLTQMDADKLGDAASVTKKAGEHVHEIRDTTDPHYISQLLVTILAGLGRATEGRRIKKRVADEVLWLNAAEPWRRAPLWLIIRVALQTTLKSRHDYKSFMVFLLCRLISEAVKRDVYSDLLFTMRAKVARRFYKLSESPTPAFVDISVETTVRQASRLLQDRWDVIQKRQATSPPWNPASWDLESATVIKLPKAYDYIDRALNRHKDISDQVFTPPNPPHLRHVSDFVQYHEGKLTEAYQAQGLVTLLDFEESIRTYIDSWVEMNLHNSVACEILASCFNQYYSAAKTEYPSHPEDRSIMVLTLMELWMALDKVAATQFPLLRDYTPDIPPTFLHPLLFRHFHFIDRANKIERYILERYRSSKYSSVFTDELTDTSISVIYFRQSQTLQDLKARIERRAETERSAKAAELR